MAETRKIAAILAADVVGFSRLANAAEDRTLAQLRTLRTELIDPTVASQNGRVFKRTGDGALVEFRSVVEAVRCAVTIQSAMIDRNVGMPEDQRIVLRIGIHLGDVVEESDGDLMGDGVNIAARLEGIAEPGAICLSEDAYRQVKGRLDLAVSDLGPTQLKNIAEPIRAFALHIGVLVPPKPASPPDPARLALPDKPSIAVLPFQNMSGDAEQEYFVDGMVEDIITGLSRIKWLFVIARNSSFTYKGMSVDIRKVGRELGVRYVLEGSVRKAGGRLRITAQLIEAETGAHIWADRFDGALEDAFDLQDKITEKVVSIVEPSLRQSEIERARRKPPGILDAQDLFWRALPHMRKWRPADCRIAIGILEQALELDPNHAPAHATLAFCHMNCFFYGGIVDLEKSAALSHARRVIASATQDADALARAALVIAHLDKDYPTALSAIDRALAQNPSCASANFIGAMTYTYCGNSAGGKMLADRGLRLSPFDPSITLAYHALGISAFVEGRFDEACAQFAKQVQTNSGVGFGYFFHAVALVSAGRIEEARPVAQRGLELEPGWRSRQFSVVGHTPEVVNNLVASARLLGLPE